VKLLGLTLLFAQAFGGEDFYQDFRIKGLDPEVFALTGQDAAQCVKVEPEGVRITLPAGRKSASTVGLVLRAPVQGDFEITTGYEILQADPPKAGIGAGFTTYLMTNSPTKEATEFFHFVRPSGSEAYGCARLTTTPDGRRIMMPGLDLADHPVLGKAGQMRVTRVGSQTVLSAAREGSSDFKGLYQFDLGSADVVVLRVGANPGNVPNPLDVRLRDFRARFKGVAASLGVVPEAERGSHLLLALALAAAIALAGLLFWLYRRRAEKREASRAARGI
jgi:hypothetical protein